MAVWEIGEIMREQLEREIEMSRGQLRIEIRHGEASNGIAHQIELSNVIQGARSRGTAINGGRHETHQVAVGKQLHWQERRNSRGISEGVSPDDIPLEIRSEGSAECSLRDGIDQFHTR